MFYQEKQYYDILKMFSTERVVAIENVSVKLWKKVCNFSKGLLFSRFSSNVVKTNIKQSER